MECINPDAAVMKAEALPCKLSHVGAIAFSRSGDTRAATSPTPKLIRKFGDVPDDLSVL